MLKNQDIPQPYRVALGYELFFDPRGINKVSMTRIAAFRRTVNTRVTGFQYFFVADTNFKIPELPCLEEFFDACLRFGAFFADKYILPLPERANDLNELLFMCDLIYAPSLMASRGITGRERSSVLPPDSFLRAYDRSLEGSRPFELIHFRQQESAALSA